jgi:hypothetical protein
MNEPFKVLHVYYLGYEVSKIDLIQLFKSFKIITKLVMLHNEK